ncbi:ABC transporter permease [Paracoccus aminophilus]|uniref:Uncharacterized protein n=1 Tax=Paracoccus aminophilus JCM 7686 TaxID=1367847 RepID=S5Z0F4_PARAH|nr:FtsX-like permease family protein [Paracoccus aminophilus]AGT10946.1 hypothetical protein JCM7686_pAMI4p256 [Paracoccus aminophilus JCM 7686]
MADLALITTYLKQSKLRTAFTAGSIIVAFILLGLFLPVLRVFDSRVDFGDADRLMVVSKTSVMTPLPVGLGERIKQIDGVREVSHFTFFGGTYRAASNRIAAIVTDPALFPNMVDEVAFNDSEGYRRWLAEPASVAVGREMANAQGWKVGDLIPIRSLIYIRKDGSPIWTFRIATIFDPATKDSVTNSMVINYSYFNHERSSGADTVGWFAVRVDDPRHAEAVAAAIDKAFANSPNETTATTEKAYAQSFLKQVGNFKAMITVALALVFWTLILITSNAVMQGIRSRFSDFAIMRTLGFASGRIARLIFSEVAVLMAAAGLLGMAIANIVVLIVATRTDQLLSLMRLDWRDWAIAFGLITLCTLVISITPIVQERRQKIISGLGEAVQ